MTFKMAFEGLSRLQIWSLIVIELQLRYLYLLLSMFPQNYLTWNNALLGSYKGHTNNFISFAPSVLKLMIHHMFNTHQVSIDWSLLYFFRVVVCWSTGAYIIYEPLMYCCSVKMKLIKVTGTEHVSQVGLYTNLMQAICRAWRQYRFWG